MATLTQIGARIELEGADAFKTQMKQIANLTKTLNSQMKALTSSFDSDAKTVQQLRQQKTLLAEQIANTKYKLDLQKDSLEQATQKAKEQLVVTEQQQKQLQTLALNVDKTTVEYNELLQKQRELAQDNSLTLFVDAWKNAGSKTGEALKTIGEGMTKAFTLPIVGAGVVATKEFTSLQSAFTGVRKTVEGTEEELESLRVELSKIPLETASTTESVYAVAEAAGQLNVGLEDIPKFTKNIIMLADSTNILADEGAVNIAQFLNIMGESPKTVDQFGNALVELGNTTATDEASILRLATRLASAGKLVGLTTPEILGLSAAMSAVGLTAEAGGTAMSTTMKMISKDVATGGENLKLYAEITGQTAEEFAETWRKEPIKALQDFLIGMANLEGGSEAVIQMLDELGFSGIRQSDTLQRLTLDYDGLEKAVKSANEQYYGGNALSEEASKRYADFASSVSQLKESFKLFMAEIGDDIVAVLQPMVQGLAETIQKLTTWWSELDQPMKNFILSALGVVAAIGPILAIGGNLLIWGAKLKAAFTVLSISFAGVGTALAGFGSAIGSFVIGPYGLIIGSIVGMIAWIKSLGITWEEWTDFFAFAGNFLKDTFLDLVDFINEKLEDGLNWASRKIEYALKDINLLWRNIWNGIKEFSKAMFNGINSNLESGLMWASRKFDSFKNFISNMGTSISNIFSNLANAAWNWGKDMINNFASGVMSKLQSAINAVSSVASRIRSYLHFSQPDVGPLSDFNTWMPDMMKGLAKGINDNAYLVDNAINRVAEGMSLGMNGGVSYGGVVINMNVPQGANGYQLVNEIEQEIANRTMRRRMVFN